ARLNLMTQSEREALDHCLRGAIRLRLSMNVAERSEISIEEHGHLVFDRCLEIARNAGIYLSSIEKYLLHCVAYLHDLGYFRGYARDRAGQNRGWELLRTHGVQTDALLTDSFENR